MFKILLVEDDSDLSNITSTFLSHSGHIVDAAYTYAEAEALISENTYDIILLDIMLPDRNGDELCREVRNKCNCPIIFMSCLEDSGTIVGALYDGGDDYMVKPVRFPELLARIEAVVRRTSTQAPSVSQRTKSDVRVFKSFTLDTLHRKINRDGDEIDLSGIEYSLLAYMVDHPETLLLYQDLYRNIWHSDCLGDFRTVMVHVSNLRKKLDPDQSGIISTIRGAGYIFTDV